MGNPLLAHGSRHFSQNDEDGILLEILRRIDITGPSAFLEFGVGDGTECNTIILLALGWKGAWIGDKPIVVESGARLAFEQRWIVRDNAAEAATTALARVGLSLREIRVASVDLDGNDGAVVRTLLSAGISPDVFIVEYNAKFPPGVEFELPYSDSHFWKNGDYYGVALQTWLSILTDHRLVACNENGTNAFFVKHAHSERFRDVSKSINDLYRVGHYQPRQISGHPTSIKTVQYLASR